MLAVLPLYPALESERIYYLCVQCLHEHVLLAIAADTAGVEGEDVDSVTLDVQVRRRHHRGLGGYKHNGSPD